MDEVFEQAQRWAQFWTDMASRTAAAPGVEPNGSPTEVTRQARAAAFRAMSEAAERFMRSPQFLAAMKQNLEAALTTREQFNELFTRMHHATQGVARQDVDNLLLAIQHQETRLIGRLDELYQRLDAIEARLDALAAVKGGTAEAPPASAKKPDKGKGPRRR
jgi:hypothetical protein